MRGTWQTTGSSVSGAGLAVAAIVIAVVAVPVISALARLAEVLVIVLGVVAPLAVLAAAAVAVYRVRHGHANVVRRTSVPGSVSALSSEPLSAPRRPAIDAPKQELHIHFHGVTAEDVAAIIARQRGE